jgi:hypothetical protein
MTKFSCRTSLAFATAAIALAAATPASLAYDGPTFRSGL